MANSATVNYMENTTINGGQRHLTTLNNEIIPSEVESVSDRIKLTRALFTQKKCARCAESVSSNMMHVRGFTYCFSCIDIICPHINTEAGIEEFYKQRDKEMQGRLMW